MIIQLIFIYLLISAENNTRIKIINLNNKGVSDSKNIGFKYSNDEFLYFREYDSYLDNTALYDLDLKAVNNNLDLFILLLIIFILIIKKIKIKKNNIKIIINLIFWKL